MTGTVARPRRRWTLNVRIDRFYVGVRGWRAKETLDRTGKPARWNDETREWYLSGRQAHKDALAALESCGAALLIEGQELPEVQPDRGVEQVALVDVDHPDIDVDVPLFDAGGGDAA